MIDLTSLKRRFSPVVLLIAVFAIAVGCEQQREPCDVPDDATAQEIVDACLEDIAPEVTSAARAEANATATQVIARSDATMSENEILALLHQHLSTLTTQRMAEFRSLTKAISNSEAKWQASYVGKGEWLVDATGYAVGPADVGTRAKITASQWNDYGDQLVENPAWCYSTATLDDQFSKFYVHTYGIWNVFEKSEIVKPVSGSAIALEYCATRWPK